MERPCVRVPRGDGEVTRRDLDAAGLLDDDAEIHAADGYLYLPVTDPDALPSEYEVVRREVATRKRPETPADHLGFDPSYERIGDVAILDSDDPDRAADIAAAILESDLPIRAVLNRASKVKGDLRVREWEVLAVDPDRDDGRRPTETAHREYGYEYRLDLATVYFSPRLATERRRVTTAVEAGEFVVDMFAGVGPFAVPMADRGAEVLAVDLNEAAVEYLRENARHNGVEDRLTAVHGDVREVAAEHTDCADRLVMNLPHSADDFLPTAVTLAGDDTLLHYYDIQHEDDPFGPGKVAIRAAAEPEGYAVDVETRRVVRSYAPHELNVRIDARLSR
jgi:tRNA (guanine37-N1)-methyltransferase